jgi:hypothetical protein
MKRKVWIVPHSHYDAEVFLVEKDTLEIGYSVLIGACMVNAVCTEVQVCAGPNLPDRPFPANPPGRAVILPTDD